MIEVECAVPEGLGGVCHAIVADDVESEASGSGHDAWIVADTAAIFVAAAVADTVVAVFDAPMAPHDVGPSAGAQSFGGCDVMGDLAALLPQAGGGAAQPGVTGDADDGLDEGPHSVWARPWPAGKTSTVRFSCRDRPLFCDAAVSAGAFLAAMAPAASDSWAWLSLSWTSRWFPVAILMPPLISAQ